MSRFTEAWMKLAYLSTGEFSMTRIIMVSLFFLSIGIGVAGLLAFLIWDKVLPDNLYVYVGGLSGSGMLQYGFTKHVDGKRNGPEL